MNAVSSANSVPRILVRPVQLPVLNIGHSLHQSMALP
jgi:hypothetical protein